MRDCTSHRGTWMSYPTTARITRDQEATGLSQSQFATLLEVLAGTWQGWEQGRKQPSDAARTLLAIARTNPKATLAVSAQ